MKHLRLMVLAMILFGCEQSNTSQKETVLKKDSVTTPTTDSVVKKSNDEILLLLSDSILKCLKNKDLACLAQYVHPRDGVRFSPYAYINPESDKLFSKDKLPGLSNDKKKINWGAYDAGEEEIIMDPAAYLRKFVYDVDFLNAKKKTVNRSNASGNMINNQDSVYAGTSFTEFYFPGFDPKYDGMDWRALRLVFKNENGKFYLIGIIHDQWTI